LKPQEKRMITEYNSEMAEIVFGLVFFVAVMTATLLPYVMTSFKLSRVKA
jgi:hypothetical protein